jgi:hypothetical protein
MLLALSSYHLSAVQRSHGRHTYNFMQSGNITNSTADLIFGTVRFGSTTI